jgi:hypothetical protein
MVKRGIWSYLKETKKVEGPRFKEMVLPGGDEEKSSNIKVSVGRGGKRPIRFKCVSLGGDEDKTAGGVLKDPKYLIKGLMMLYEGSE